MMKLRTIPLSLILFSASAWANNPFAPLPAYLNNTTVTAEAGVKPNVLFLLDDSGSMMATCSFKTRLKQQNYGPLFTVDPVTDTVNITKSCRVGHASSPDQVGDSRLKVAVEAMEKQIGQYQDKVNWSIRTINYGQYGQVATEKMPPDKAAGVSAKLKRYWIDKDSWHTVPLREPLSEMGLNTDFTSDWQSVLSELRKLKPAPDDTTPYGAIMMRPNGSYWMNAAFHGAGTPSTQAYVDSIAKMNDAIRYRCQKNYIVFLSDGDAAADPSKQSVGAYPYSRTQINFNKMLDTVPFGRRVFGSALPASPSPRLDPYQNQRMGGENKGISFFSRRLSQNDLKTSADGTDGFGKSWDADQTLFPKQNIETYTIGFGGGLTPNGASYLNWAATGQDDASGKNSYFFSATDNDSLNKAFDSIFNSISASSSISGKNSYSSSAPALDEKAAPEIFAGLSLDTSNWSSEIRLYDLRLPLDKSRYTTPVLDGRRFLIHDGRKADWAESGVYSNAFFGLSGTGNEWKTQMIPWLMKQNVPGYRNNPAMGAVLGSPLVPVKDGNGNQKWLVTAANDGMLYLFEKEADEYKLKLNYIPAAVPKGQGTLATHFKEQADPAYGRDLDHPPLYMMNGGITVRRTNARKGLSQTFLAANMGQGGRGMVMLNLGGTDVLTGRKVGLDSSDWKQDVPLRQIRNDGRLGYTVSTPHIARVALNRVGRQADISRNVVYAAFTGNGYNHPDNNRKSSLAVYQILDADVGLSATGGQAGKGAGELLYEIPAGTGGGLSEPTLIDTDFDGVVDIAYAGDYAGDLYRFDLRYGTPIYWNATRIFSSGKPITSAPAVLKLENNRYVVVFGTGSDLYESDSKDREYHTLYGIYDNIDKPVKETFLSQLVRRQWDSVETNRRTISSLADGIQEDKLNFAAAAENVQGAKAGWYLDLPDRGERVVTRPHLELKTAIFTTRQYHTSVSSTGEEGDKCIAVRTETSSSATSWLIQLNAATGGMVKGTRKDGTAYIDFENAGNKDSNGKLNAPPQALFSGYRLGGVASFAVGNGNQILEGLSVSNNGEEIFSGESLLLGSRPKPKTNCFRKRTQGTRNIFVHSTEGGPIANFQFSGPECPRTVKRITWREIF